MPSKRFFHFGYMQRGAERIPAVEEWVRNGSSAEKWGTYDCSKLSAAWCRDQNMCDSFQTLLTIEGNEGGVGGSLVFMSEEAKKILNQFDDAEVMLLRYLEI